MKFFKHLYLLLSLVIAVPFVACDDDDDTVIVNDVTLPYTELAVPVGVFDAPFEYDLAVKATVRPTVSADASWVEVKNIVPGTDNTSYTVNFVIQPNIDKDGVVGAPRTATLSVSAFNAAQIITITQEGSSDYNLNYGNLGMVSSAKELAKKMGTGVNIGNTLESVNSDGNGNVTGTGETLWGNPAINAQYIAGIKAAGFKSVRIPCSWVANYEKVKDVMGNDSTTTTISPSWIARVKEVVSYCIDNDLYVVLNDHYDAAWIETTMPEGFHSSKGEQLADLWTQIANAFNEFDEHLLFAGLNEPGCESGKPYQFETLTKYEQIFIDAVRATGGNNATRTLIVQGPSTNIDLTCGGEYTMPVDAVADRLMIEVHFYDPYQFCLMDEDASWGKVWWYYGDQNHVAGSDRNNGEYGNEEWVAGQFKKMYDKYAANGIPVILGEYGANNKTAALDQEKQVASRAYWHEIVNREAIKNGCVPFLWECGESGEGDNFSMCDFDRNTGRVKNPQVVEAILRGAAASTLPF